MIGSAKASTEAGSFIALVEMPLTWPPANPMLLRSSLADGYLAVEIGFGRRIRVRLVRVAADVEQTLFCVLTCRIASELHSRFVLMIGWSDHLRVNAGDVLIGSTDESETVELSYRARYVPVELDKRYDYSSLSSKCRNKRKELLRKIESNGKINKDTITHIKDSLAEEVQQISDLLRLIRNGKHAHVRGLAARLRVLLSSRGQSPLLQTFAAINDAPLIVYTVAGRADGVSLAGQSVLTAMASSRISPTPSRFLTNPIDIDVWLEENAMYVSGRPVTQIEMIWEIGNKIGNHLDPKSSEIISALRSVVQGDLESERNLLSKYVCDVAEAVICLSNMLLKES